MDKKKKASGSELETLKESMKMIEELLDNAYYGMVLVDSEGYIVKWNYEKLFGKSEAEVLGKHVKDVIENTRLHIVVKTGVKEICDIQEINGTNVITSRIPIFQGDKVIGAAGTILFKDTNELQLLAKRIRSLEETIDKYKGEVSRMYEARYSFEDIKTHNHKMRELKEIARRVAKTNSTVLIQGASGTGKELFAHAIHKESLRKYGNFVTLNCAAIPKELLEAELFGYEEGAFTGAKKGGKIGKFELAQGGTILLDEIGTMPLEMQSKLLRVLEAREFERVGGNKRVKLDVRIIASTNENLEQAVQKGDFRSDLFYRLNVIRIEIPSLKDRIDDIDILSKAITETLSQDLLVGKKILAPDTISILKQHLWPGNVRELRNVLERAINFAPLNIILPEHLPEYILKNSDKTITTSLTLKDITERAEIEAIKKAVEKSNGNKTIAAQELNIHRTSLYKKIEKYNLTELMD